MSAVCRALLKFPELSRRAQPSNTEESRAWQSGEWSMKEKKRCFISGAAEAWGSEVNVDFLHMRREWRAAWVIWCMNHLTRDYNTHAAHAGTEGLAMLKVKLPSLLPIALQFFGPNRNQTHPFKAPLTLIIHLPLYSSHSIQCLKSRRLQSHSQGLCPSSRCCRLASGSNAALSKPWSLLPARDIHLWNRSHSSFAKDKKLPCDTDFMRQPRYVL